jgi:hypothetical protein
MQLLLATESNCQFFKFWFNQQVHDGINYRGEIFLLFHNFPLRRRDQAYEIGSRLVERGIAIVIVCSKERYSVGINLRSEWWNLSQAEQQPFWAAIQGG